MTAFFDDWDTPAPARSQSVLPPVARATPTAPSVEIRSLDEIAIAESPASAATAAVSTSATLTALPDDRAFLQTFFDRADWQSRDLSPDTRVALAARLVNFGLTDPALRLLSTLPEQTARHLRARIQLLLGDAQAALDILAGLGDDAAEALRAQARRVLDAAAPVPDDAEPPPPALSPQTLAPSEGIMRRGTALLTESAQLRDSLTDLLRPAP